MTSPPTRYLLRALLSGVLLTGCGGIPDEAGPTPAGEESVGTRESAMCSTMSVTHLAVSGMDSYEGVLAGAGTWTVSPNANSVYLEYYLDNNPTPTMQRLPGTYDPSTGTTSGTWSYSIGGVSCGGHTVTIKAYARHISSNGAEEICSTPMTVTRTVIQDGACKPTTSVSCKRISNATIRCTGTASGGSGSYTPYWQEYWDSEIYQEQYLYDWFQRPWTADFQCVNTTSTTYYDLNQYHFRVIDSTGMPSTVSSSPVFKCWPVA
ncbi:hypothetical protein [Archangium violaceum]|uniref:hypothetical protein n=1 Tax=Archangium violaceum TaxID=83451 RepID=UPI000698D7EA|nr:hypothetical protein [Archangium violaceum]